MNDKPKSIPEISLDSMTLYRKLEKLEEGETIEYEELSDLIKRDVRSEARGNLTTAVNRCRSNNQIVIKPVRGIGMRRVPNTEVTGVAADRLTRARRQTRQGLKELACVDYDKLDADQRVKHDSNAIMLGTLHAMSKPSKTAAIETKIKETNEKLTTQQTLEFFATS